MWARVTGEWPSGDEEACEREIGLHDGVELLPGGPFFVKLAQVFAVFFLMKMNTIHAKHAATII